MPYWRNVLLKKAKEKVGTLKNRPYTANNAIDGGLIAGFLCIGFDITYWKLMQYCKLYRRITKVPIHVFYMKLRKITEIAKISFAYLCKCAMKEYIFSASF